MKKNFIPAFSALAFFTFSLFAFFSCTTTKQTDTAQETAASEIETPESNVQEELSAQRLIELGKIEEAKTLFASKVDINSIDKNGNTALHAAAKINDADLCIFLLAKGIDSSLKNYDSDTALHVAIKNDSFESARILSVVKNDIFAINKNNETALEQALKQNEVFYDIMINERTAALNDQNGQNIIHYFVKFHDEKAVQLAIKKSLPIDNKDKAGKTPLQLALNDAENDSSVKIAAELIKDGAQPIAGEFEYFEEAVMARNMNFRYSDGEIPLHISASLGHFAVSKYLAVNGSSVKAQDISGSTPLHCAVRNGHTEIARLLLENNADVNALDTLGKTPLLLIIPEEKQQEMYTLLLSKGADSQKKDTFGDSVLHTATLMNVQPEILDLLVKFKADLNARNKEGVTPLLMAVEMNSLEHIDFYVKKGADINASDVNGRSPLTEALLQNFRTVKALVTKDNVNSIDSKGNTPIHTAILKNAPLESFAYIARLCRDINARNAEGNTALYIAIQKNRRDIGDLLVNMDANIFITNTRNYSPLRIAFAMGGDICEWIITSKTIAATDGSGNTAMHYAAEWEESGAITLLKEKGADINAKNANGETPLFSAVKTDNGSLIELLVKLGADFKVRDNSGSTALHSAVRWNTTGTTLALINAGAYINAQNSTGITPLAEAVSAGNLEMAELLLDNGADVNACDTKGKSILSFAVQTQNINAVNLLLKNNADLYIQEFDGKNAFHEAVLTENVEIIRKIQQSGGDALSRDKNGTTPFALSLTKSEDIIRAVVGKNKNLTDSDGNTLMHIAVANNAKVAVINELISENYPFDTRNSSGVTPLYLAAETNQLASVDALLSGGANPFTASGKKDGCTVSLALQKNDQLLLNTILKYAAHKTDMQGNTILHYAAKLSNAETVKKLLAADINPAVKNIAGETAYNIAVNWQKTEIAQLLKQ